MFSAAFHVLQSFHIPHYHHHSLASDSSTFIPAIAGPLAPSIGILAMPTNVQAPPTVRAPAARTVLIGHQAPTIRERGNSFFDDIIFGRCSLHLDPVYTSTNLCILCHLSVSGVIRALQRIVEKRGRTGKKGGVTRTLEGVTPE